MLAAEKCARIACQKIAGPPVMEEEHPLSNAPQRRGAEFVATGLTLKDVVCEPYLQQSDLRS
jgi:hypothetical protein